MSDDDSLFSRLQADERNGYYLIGEARELRQMPEYGDYFDGQAAVARVDNRAVDPVRQKRLARIKMITYRRSELGNIPPPGWQVDGVMTRASLTLLAGKFGTYKSFVSVALAASVATGRPFLGLGVVQGGPVVYVAAEGASGARGRFEAWEAARNDGLAIPDDRLVVVGGAVNILNDADVDGLRNLCRAVGPCLIVWDTLHRCAPGLDENSSQESGQVVEVLDRLREEFECTQLVNHHTGHGGVRARGSSSWEDDFDNTWVIKLGGDGEDRSPENQRTLIHRKVKDGELSSMIDIGLNEAGGGVYVDRKTVGSDLKGSLMVKGYAQRLDAAGVRLDAGRTVIARELKAMGVERLDNNVAQRIATLRKRSDYVPFVPAESSADV